MNNKTRSLSIIAATLIVLGAALGLRQPSAPPVSGVYRASVNRIVDGDSLYLVGVKPQIRLWGVDAPERDEDGFKAATDYLRKIAKDRELECRQVDQDRYRRIVARCFLPDDQEINRMMIESGTAAEYIRYSNGFYGGS
jgi:endonuclease YncB( thermonuclease family)